MAISASSNETKKKRNYFPLNNFPEASSSAQSSPRPESSNQVNQVFMKKTLFYDFLPSKAVEDAERAQNIPHQVTWQLIEIRDEHPFPWSEYHDCPTLIKVIHEEDVTMGKLHISHRTAFDYMFRHWPMPVVQDILIGREYYMKIFEYKDYDHGSGVVSNNNTANLCLWFGGDSRCFANWSGMVHYFLYLSKMLQARRIAVGDVIHYGWDTQNQCIVLKVVHRET